MQEDKLTQAGRVLMAMTEAEAAALALLDTIEREREAIRAVIEGDST